MDKNEFKSVLKEFISELNVELVSQCPGHMASTNYWMVVSHQGDKLIKLKLGDDGFNDGDELGFQFNSSRFVKKVDEI